MSHQSPLFKTAHGFHHIKDKTLIPYHDYEDYRILPCFPLSPILFSLVPKYST